MIGATSDLHETGSAVWGNRACNYIGMVRFIREQSSAYLITNETIPFRTDAFQFTKSQLEQSTKFSNNISLLQQTWPTLALLREPSRLLCGTSSCHTKTARPPIAPAH